jgi:hypothetical protein
VGGNRRSGARQREKRVDDEEPNDHVQKADDAEEEQADLLVRIEDGHGHDDAQNRSRRAVDGDVRRAAARNARCNRAQENAHESPADARGEVERPHPLRPVHLLVLFPDPEEPQHIEGNMQQSPEAPPHVQEVVRDELPGLEE